MTQRRGEVERTPGRRPEDDWHIVRGIPIAVIVAFTIQTLVMIAGGGWFARGVMERQEAMDKRLARVETTVDKLDASIQGGSIPTALNARRIDDLERVQASAAVQIQALAVAQQGFAQQLIQLAARMSETERRLSSESLRSRAARER